MNRDDWKFPYRAVDVLKGAEAKRDYHSSRVSWWEAKFEEVKKKVKEDGIEFDVSLADITSNSYAQRGGVTVRNDLMRDINECQQKVREHKGKTEEYAAWCEVLASQKESVVQLESDDWLYFFGGQAKQALVRAA